MTGARRGTERWFREPFAWLVFGLPAAAVIGCLITIAIAVATSDDLVVDDYYRRGLAINKVLVREAAAEALGLRYVVAVEPDGGFQLDLKAPPDFTYPPRVDVVFAHATRGGADRVASAAHLGRGVYRGRVDALTRGYWYVEVSTPEWRLVQRIAAPPGPHG